jgi:hypothetical protein
MGVIGGGTHTLVEGWWKVGGRVFGLWWKVGGRVFDLWWKVGGRVFDLWWKVGGRRSGLARNFLDISFVSFIAFKNYRC